MDLLKQKRITNNGDDYFRHCVNYPFKAKTEPGEELVDITGYGVSNTDPQLAYDQMQAIKEYYGKTGDNPVMHFIISYDQNVQDANTACKYTGQIADYFSEDYQMITAVHKEDQGGSQYHGHIIMNSVNLNDGKLYHSGITELKQLAMHVHEVTGNYCKTEIEK